MNTQHLPSNILFSGTGPGGKPKVLWAGPSSTIQQQPLLGNYAEEVGRATTVAELSLLLQQERPDVVILSKQLDDHPNAIEVVASQRDKNHPLGLVLNIDGMTGIGFIPFSKRRQLNYYPADRQIAAMPFTFYTQISRWLEGIPFVNRLKDAVLSVDIDQQTRWPPGPPSSF